MTCDGPVNGSDPTGSGTSDFEGARMSGTFEARPTKGDCASSPVTGVHVSGRGVLN